MEDFFTVTVQKDHYYIQDINKKFIYIVAKNQLQNQINLKQLSLDISKTKLNALINKFKEEKEKQIIDAALLKALKDIEV